MPLLGTVTFNVWSSSIYCFFSFFHLKCLFSWMFVCYTFLWNSLFPSLLLLSPGRIPERGRMVGICVDCVTCFSNSWMYSLHNWLFWNYMFECDLYELVYIFLFVGMSYFSMKQIGGDCWIKSPPNRICIITLLSGHLHQLLQFMRQSIQVFFPTKQRWHSQMCLQRPKSTKD